MPVSWPDGFCGEFAGFLGPRQGCSKDTPALGNFGKSEWSSSPFSLQTLISNSLKAEPLGAQDKGDYQAFGRMCKCQLC